MARKTTAQVKRRLVLTVPITLAIILATTFTSVLELKKIRSYEKEKKTLTLELEKLKEDAESLNLEINRLNSPEYIARYAREKFLYTKDGEKLIIVDELTKEQQIEESNKEIDYLTYILIGVGSLLFITIVYIIVKKSKKA
ncbi:MAG: septum formation initiator family protein [Bacillales bacterium]|nr:septum formation initiator family protein [Bacillales bacterium]